MQAAIRVQTIFRRRLMKYRCKAKHQRKLEQAAIRIQRAFRRDCGPSLVKASQVGSLPPRPAAPPPRRPAASPIAT